MWGQPQGSRGWGRTWSAPCGYTATFALCSGPGRAGSSKRQSRAEPDPAMDVPPLASRVAALSLGALPLSLALSLVSQLSQCVRAGRREGSLGGLGLGMDVGG